MLTQLLLLLPSCTKGKSLKLQSKDLNFVSIFGVDYTASSVQSV